MAIDYVRNIISSGYNLAKINDNFAKIETALQDAVSRSGNGPNQMEADFDMNSNDILNANIIEAEQLRIDGVAIQPVDLATALKIDNNLSDVADLGISQDNMQIGAIFADVATVNTAFIPPRNKKIHVQYRDGDRVIGSGFDAKRISFASLSSYPALSFFRSTDRFLPDGSMDSVNGGYWVIDEVVLHPQQFGGKPDDVLVDNSPAIQAAIDLDFTTGTRMVDLTPARWWVGSTIIVKTKTFLSGHGKDKSKIAANPILVASNGSVVETENFTVNTGTQTKLVTDPTMVWGFNLIGFSVEGGWNRDWTNAVSNHLHGRGINIYGRRFNVRDVGVYYTRGIGFYTECGNPSTPPANWYFNYENNQDGVIEDVDILFTAYEGFVTFGPGDSFIDKITVGLAGDAIASVHPQGTPLNSLLFPGDRITNFVMSANDTSGASGTHEIGVIHAHTNWNGWGFRALGGATRLVRLKAENLIAEGCLGAVFIQNGVYGQIDKINTRNNSVTALSSPTQFSEIILSSNFEIQIDSIESRKSASSNGLTSVRVLQDDVQIGTIKVEGNGQPGHAVTIENNIRDVRIGSIWAENCRGTAQDGNASASFFAKTACTNVTVGTLMSQFSDYGWLNASTGRVAVLSGHAEVSNTHASNVSGIQLNSTPTNQYINKSRLTSTSLTGTVLFPDCRQIVTATAAGLANPAIVQSGVALTIAHGMWRTPDFQREIDITVQYNGTLPTVPPFIQPTGATATNVTATYNQSVTSAGSTSGGTVINLKI